MIAIWYVCFHPSMVLGTSPYRPHLSIFILPPHSCSSSKDHLDNIFTRRVEKCTIRGVIFYNNCDFLHINILLFLLLCCLWFLFCTRFVTLSHPKEAEGDKEGSFRVHNNVVPLMISFKLTLLEYSIVICYLYNGGVLVKLEVHNRRRKI